MWTGRNESANADDETGDQGDGTLPRQLALDGKFVKEVMGVVSVVNAETGAPVAVAACTRKEGERGRCRKKGVGRTIEDAMNAPEAPTEAPTEAPRPHSVRMDGHESAPN